MIQRLRNSWPDVSMDIFIGVVVLFAIGTVMSLGL